jgi:hypothetical protein
MVVIQQHLLNTNKSKYRLDFKGESAPISIQIAGSEVENTVIAFAMTIFHKITNSAKLVILLIIPTYAKASI